MRKLKFFMSRDNIRTILRASLMFEIISMESHHFVLVFRHAKKYNMFYNFKSFFRRSLKRQADMVCAKDGNCNIKYGEVKGTPCPACRVSRCLAVGMSLDGMFYWNHCNNFRLRMSCRAHKYSRKMLTGPLKAMNRVSQSRYNSVNFIFNFNFRHYSHYLIKTRMHSSRMRTVRCSGHGGEVYPSMHSAGGFVYPSMHWAGVCVSQHPLGRGVCIPACTGQGGVWPGGVSAWGWDVCPGGCVFPEGCLPGGGGVCLGVGGVCPGEGCLPSGVSVTPPSPCEQNDRHLWKHNLAATTLRAVKMQQRKSSNQKIKFSLKGLYNSSTVISHPSLRKTAAAPMDGRNRLLDITRCPIQCLHWWLTEVPYWFKASFS